MSMAPRSIDEKFRPDYNKDPSTIFSASRLPSGSVKSNRELIEDLRRAGNLNRTQAHGVLIQITWSDASAGGKVSCSFSFASSKVHGGRLGRDHEFEDVPNHYVRDRLMDYIDTQLPEDKREAARRAVFPDLSDDDIAGYSAMIAKERLEVELKEAKKDLWGYQIMESVKPAREAKLLVQQHYAVDDIDDEIDLSPLPGAARLVRMTGPFPRSVIFPGEDPTPEECALDFEQYRADWNCDQVRAMIKRQAETSGWSIELLRLTLGNTTRQQMTKFMKGRGSKCGQGHAVYHLASGFFKRREQLGVPLGSSAVGRSGSAGKSEEPAKELVMQSSSSKREQEDLDSGEALTSRRSKRAKVN
ncbi:hypothetical protein GQ53DRAFT_835357 [Thozetella sp. PMI_491]|nr:hypothetical protein GQ53DRAFT_835357 [Thozetella sp. PMI_491]